jgi:hypothetical protein
MDPIVLRDCVKDTITELIEPIAWKRCEIVNAAEMQSLQTVLGSWKGAPEPPPPLQGVLADLSQANSD